jgi:hypothetical protein
MATSVITTATTSLSKWRPSSSDRPLVVHSAADAHIIDAAGNITVIEVKAGAKTLPSDKRPMFVPRVVESAGSDQPGFMLLQKWDGYVIDVDAEAFTGHLIDSRGMLPPHDATFSRAELPKEEQVLIAAGAPFVWTIGYRQIGATRERTSVIYFRRLPNWAGREIISGAERGENLGREVGWE